MKLKRFFAAVLAVVMTLSAIPAFVQAEKTEQTEVSANHNIVVLVDSGGSLKQGITSDPDEYRFEAIGMFFDLLSDIGDYISAIVFRGNNEKNDSSDAAMRERITSFSEEGLKQITSKEDKEDMKNFITQKAGGYTDIGTALLVAAEQLEGKTQENGLDSYIILFTDGETEFADGAPQAYYDKSMANQEKALEMIRENGITLCAVYLDHEGKQNRENVANLVRASLTDDPNVAKSIPVEQLETDCRYIRVTSAKNLADVFQSFFNRLSSATQRELERTDRFTIPGSGVREVNICITTEKSDEIVGGTMITSLVNNKTGAVDMGLLFDCRTSGYAYVVYKLVNPEPGEYEITWTSSDPGAKCTMMANLENTAGITMETKGDKPRYGEPITFSGCLYNQGEALKRSSDYSEYVCVLEVYNRNTESLVHEQTLFQNNEGIFSTPYIPEAYGSYYAQIAFVCNDFRICSNKVFFAIDNDPPKADAAKLPVSISFGGDGIKTVELSKYIHDTEDELAELVIVPDESNTYPLEAFEIAGDNSTLTIRGREGGSGTLVLRVNDTQDRHDLWYVEIKVRDNTLLILLSLTAAVVAAALYVLGRKRQIMENTHVDGSLEFKLTINDTPCRLIPLDAMECLNKNLYEILSCRKHMLIHIFSEDPENRANADNEINIFLNLPKLKSYRFFAIPKRGGKYELRLAGPESNQDQRDAGKPIGDKRPEVIELARNNTVEFVYKKV